MRPGGLTVLTEERFANSNGNYVFKLMSTKNLEFDNSQELQVSFSGIHRVKLIESRVSFAN
jgi:hypothetical protein